MTGSGGHVNGRTSSNEISEPALLRYEIAVPCALARGMQVRPRTHSESETNQACQLCKNASLREATPVLGRVHGFDLVACESSMVYHLGFYVVCTSVRGLGFRDHCWICGFRVFFFEASFPAALFGVRMPRGLRFRGLGDVKLRA